MSQSFVHDLEIAHDVRLQQFRPHQRTFEGERREAAGPAHPPEIISDNPRAAVNAGSLVSFFSGVTTEEKSDVLFSTQIAQRAASAKFDRFDATQDWYAAYSEVLERLGWVGESFALTDRGSSAGEFSMDKSVLNVIASIATGNQLAILVKTLLQQLKPPDSRSLRNRRPARERSVKRSRKQRRVHVIDRAVPTHDAGNHARQLLGERRRQRGSLIAGARVPPCLAKAQSARDLALVGKPLTSRARPILRRATGRKDDERRVGWSQVLCAARQVAPSPLDPRRPPAKGPVGHPCLCRRDRTNAAPQKALRRRGACRCGCSPSKSSVV
jgi:hypothetical protein